MPAADLRSYKVTDFSGGLNVKLSPAKLARQRPNRFLTTATNVVFNTDGSVAKRWGQRAKVTSSDVTGDVIYGGTYFEWASGAGDVFTDDDEKAYFVDDYDTPGTATIKSGLASGLSYWATYNGLLVMVNETDAPQSWDGTTWQALSGTPPTGASYVVAHGNRLFMLGTFASARHTLYYSKLNVATNWTAANDAGNMDISPDDHIGLVTLVPSNQELIILKQNRPFRLRGIGPLTGYTVADHLTPTVGSIGVDLSLGRRTAVFAANDVWYVSQLGVHRLKNVDTFGDLSESFISEPIEPMFRLGHPLAIMPSPVDWATNPATLVYDRVAGALMLLLQDGAISHKTILHYDIGMNTWAKWSLSVNAARTMWPSQHRGSIGGGVDPTLAHEVNLAINPSGSQVGIVAFDRTSTSDIGASFAAVGITATAAHVSDLGEAGVEKKPRHIYLYFTEQSSSTTMTLNLYKDFQTSAVFTTTFDIASATAESVIVKRINLSSFVCEFLTVEVTNGTAARTFTWLGYEVFWRPIRHIRRSE